MKIKISMNKNEMNELLNKLIPPTYFPEENMKVIGFDTNGYPVKGYVITIGDQPEKEEDE